MSANASPKMPADQPDLEPSPEHTIRIFRRELRFVRAMSVGTPAMKALLGANILVFLAVAIAAALLSSSLGQDVAYGYVVLLGAKNGPAIDAGQYWRLGSHMFLHANGLHILVNGYALYMLGNLLERLYGTRRFLALYFLSGFAGAAATYWFTPQNSVGASGAIFGLLGAAVAFGARYKEELPPRIRRALTFGLAPWVLINVAIGFVVPNIDNAAHMGGLVGGLIVGLMLGTPLKAKRSRLAPRLEMGIVAASLGFMLYATVASLLYAGACAQSEPALYACLEMLAEAGK